MTIETKQAAVDETKAPAEPAAAVDGAQDDGIEALLAEFDNKTQPVSQPEPKATTKDDAPDWAAVKVLIDRQNREEIKKVAERVFEGLDLPDRARNGWLSGFAAQYPEADTAFRNRERDPRTWSKWEKVLTKEAQRDFPQMRKVDADATADRDAVAAAVKAGSTKVTAEPAPNFGRMSDAELRKYTMENFGF